MAERMKDADDLWLDDLFAAEEIADDGFSDQVMAKVRRQLWIRRLTLPIAAVIGGAIAIKPLAGIVATAKNMSGLVPGRWLELTADFVPQSSFLIVGGLLLVIAILGVRALEE